jgi:sodium-dependent phosphate cotransporter
VAVVLFFFSIQLLSTATGRLSPTLGPILDSVVEGNVPALGVGWLTAYVLLNGSVVAAVALSLFTVGLVSASQLFLLVVGSRLGAAGVVVLIGGVDFLQKRRDSLREATSLGLLTFLVTHSIYVPAAVLGIAVIDVLRVDVGGLGRRVTTTVRWFEFFAPVASAVTERIGATAGLLLAFLLVVSSLRLFDRVLSTIETAKLQDAISRWTRRRVLSFALGLVVTGVSTSVAFSLGVVVPMYNRGYVDRREIVPYIMGASLGTLTDTLFVALALRSSAGVVIVLLVFGTAGVTTLVALLVYERYLGRIESLHDRLLTDLRAFLLGVALLLVVPAVFVVLPW